MANNTANRTSTALYNGYELHESTIEAIHAAPAVPADTITFSGYSPNRQTASPEMKHGPASEYDSALDPMPLRIKNKTKKMWRAVKKSVSRGWKRTFGQKE